MINLRKHPDTQGSLPTEHRTRPRDAAGDRAGIEMLLDEALSRTRQSGAG